MPETPSGGGGLDSIVPSDSGLSGKNCEYAKLWSGENYSGPSFELYDQRSPIPEVGSVKIFGDCQLILYKLTSYGENVDNIPVVLSKDTSNIMIYGTTNFGSVRLINLSFSE